MDISFEEMRLPEYAYSSACFHLRHFWCQSCMNLRCGTIIALLKVGNIVAMTQEKTHATCSIHSIMNVLVIGIIHLMSTHLFAKDFPTITYQELHVQLKATRCFVIEIFWMKNIVQIMQRQLGLEHMTASCEMRIVLIRIMEIFFATHLGGGTLNSTTKQINHYMRRWVKVIRWNWNTHHKRNNWIN